MFDFGDGSPVLFSPSASIPAHRYSAPGKYTASLSVHDSRGGASSTISVPITVKGTPLACAAPGTLAITDSAAPSLEGVDPQRGDGSDDLQYVWIGEPLDQYGKLVFTMKVASLANVPASYRWVTYFTAPDGTLYYVSMSTNDGPTPQFTYGIHGVHPAAGASTFQQLGTLDASSGFAADGTITQSRSWICRAVARRRGAQRDQCERTCVEPRRQQRQRRRGRRSDSQWRR